jgi:opacity protein-like surface antigen
LSISAAAFGQKIPRGAFYTGIGGSFDLIKFSEVDANTLGLSNVSINGNPVTSGFAGGPYTFPEKSENSFSAAAQVGYFGFFDRSNWLWGTKFTYSYIGSSYTSTGLHIPQYGAVGNQTFTGDAVVQSFEYGINSQMTLTPYFGISSGRTLFYLGGGATLSETTENIDGVVGYAFIGKEEVNISGAPTNFSSNNWVWGYAAIAGISYFINSKYFLDFSYTFGQTGNQVNDFLAPFNHSQGPVTTSGELVGRTSSHVTTNNFALTFNMAF